MKFVIQSMKLHLKVNSLESFTSQSFTPGDDYRRRLRQCELSFDGNNSYSLTITFI